MRLKSLILAGMAVAVVSAPAVLAEEIIHFTNGKAMTIKSHEVSDGMVHVDLGSDGFIAFPESRVERIEKAGQDVYLPPSFRKANVANGRYDGDVKVDAGVSNNGAFPVSGRTSTSARYSSKRGTTVQNGGGSNWQELNPVSTGLHDIRTFHPAANNVNRAARGLGAVGRTSIMQMDNSGGLVGAKAFGSKQVIEVKTSHNSQPSRNQVMRIGPRPGMPINRRGQGQGTGDGSTGANAGSAGDGGGAGSN
jgi:hypothetical protein